MSASPQDRTGIYYWKCDRAAAFHGTESIRPENASLEAQLRRALERRFPSHSIRLQPADGQGNHRTFRAAIGDRDAFVRTEDGPEHDNYFSVETAVSEALHGCGVPAPQVLACDCARTETPFAWQVLEYVPFPDLNQHAKRGTLAWPALAEAIGAAVARWQSIHPSGFGPFSAERAAASGELVGIHATYAEYYRLNLQRHLDFLTARGFFDASQTDAIRAAIRAHDDLLDIGPGCLVHKDLALWNILGAPDRIAAFIDWDDAISGDPMDDLSLLGCFYGEPVLTRALSGYAKVRPLPHAYLPRFWLHLLRNMIVKAVIRVGAGYFSRNDSFFLIGTGSSGADLERATRARIDAALRGLNQGLSLSSLT